MTPTESRACSSLSHGHDSHRVINQSGLIGKGNKSSSIRGKTRTDDDSLSLLAEKTREKRLAAKTKTETQTKNNRALPASQLIIEKNCARPPENDQESYANANGFDFGAFVSPYRNRKALDAPLASHIEGQIKAFYDSMLSKHWNKKHERPGLGMERLFFRACRDGAGERFGLVLKSLAEIKEDRKEEERLTAESDRRREEEDRRRRGEGEKEERKREKFDKFISKKPVYDLLEFMHIRSYEDQVKYLNGIMKGSEAKNRNELIKACKKELVHQMRIREPDDKMDCEYSS